MGIMLPGLWGWDAGSSSYKRTDYPNADVFNMSFVPVLTRPNYQDTGISMENSLFNESVYGDIYMTNTLGAANIARVMQNNADPWNTYPFAINMSGI